MKGYKLASVVWEITLDCNLECTHCGSSAGAPRVEELTTEESIQLINDLAELGAKNICLMGGEPFLRKDWFKLANEVNRLGIDVSFVSNGILVERIIEKLASLNPLVVGISLDGMKEVHNRIRGNDSWKLAIGALDLLASREIETTIITTVSKINLAARFLTPVGCSLWRFHVVPGSDRPSRDCPQTTLRPSGRRSHAGCGKPARNGFWLPHKLLD